MIRKLTLMTAIALILISSAAIAQVAPGTPPNKSACVNINSYSGNLQSAVNAASGANPECVYIPAGSYNQSSSVTMGSASVKIVGDGATSVINFTNDTNAGIYMNASNQGLYSFKINTTTNCANSQPQFTNIQVAGGVSSFVIDGMTVVGGDTESVVNYGGNNGRITKNIVSGSCYDGIHNQNGAYNIYIAGNEVYSTGDDMIAVITAKVPNGSGGYVSEPQEHDILIENNYLHDQVNAHGINIAGAYNVTARHNEIYNGQYFALYINVDGNWTIANLNNVIFDNNYIAQTPTYTADPRVIVVYDNVTGYTLGNVAITNEQIVNPPSGWSIDIHSGTGVKNSTIFCSGNTVNGSSYSFPNCNAVSASGITGASPSLANLLCGSTVPFPGTWPGN